MKRYMFTALLIGLCAVSQVFGAKVTNVRLTFENGATVARIDVDGPIRFAHQTEVPKDGKPDRMILDVLGATNEMSIKDFTGIPVCPIKSIRTSQYSVKPEKIARVVFDMTKAPIYSVTQDGPSIKVVFTDNSVKPFQSWAATTAKGTARTVAPAEVSSTAPALASKPSPTVTPSSTPAQQNNTAEQDRQSSLAAAKPVGATTVSQPKPEVAAAPKPQATAPAPKPSVAEAKPVATTVAPAPVVAAPKPTAMTAPTTEPKPVVATKPEVVAAKPQTQTTPAPSAQVTAPKSVTTTLPAQANQPAADTKPPATPTATATFSQLQRVSKPNTDATSKEPTAVAAPKTTTPASVETKPVAAPTTAQTSSPTPQVNPEVKATAAAPQATTPNKASTPEVKPEAKPEAKPEVKPAPAMETGTSPSSSTIPTSVTPIAKTTTLPTSTGSPTPSSTAAEPAKQPALPPTVANPEPSPTTDSAAEQKAPAVVTTDTGAEADSSAKLADEGSSPETPDTTEYKSTARFRRNPLAQAKIKGTMVAEFPKRLLVRYEAESYRDPFAPLVDDTRTNNNPFEARIPNVEGLRLVGIIESTTGDNRALLEDKNNYSYMLKSRDKVQKGYVLRVEDDKVYFQIFEYGWSRTVALTIYEKEGR
jgi:hypothetical protein